MKANFSKKWKVALAITGVAGVILALNIPAVNAQFKNAAFAALAEIQKNVWAAGASAGESLPVFAGESLAEENRRLRAQASGFWVQQAQIDALKKENEFLRQGLNLELEKEFDLKLANIAGKIPARDILIIDKGARDMIAPGMMAIDSQKAVVGKVIKTYDNFSEIQLITDKDFSFDVSIGENAIGGLFRGLGGLNAEIGLVPRDAALAPGQRVYTSGLGGIFSAGLLAGAVKEIRQNDVETFQTAAIAPAFDVAAARQVFVAVGKHPMDSALSAEINGGND